jgi:transcription antitermination factor NusG
MRDDTDTMKWTLVKTRSAQWFALAVKPRFEKSVAQALAMKGYDAFLPVYKKQPRYGARSKDSELPLFPGYVCCRFDVQSRLPILTTPGVIQVLGAGSLPIPLSDAEVNSLRTAMRGQFPIEPYPFVDTGQRVRIKGGALSGVEGIVIGCKHSLRLVLSISLLQRSVLLEIDRRLVCLEEISGSRDERPWSAPGLTSLDAFQGD